MAKFFRLSIFIVAGLSALVFFVGFIFFTFMPSFAQDSRLELSVKNQSKKPINVSVEIVDLDLNKSDIRLVEAMNPILSGAEKSTIVTLDSWIPESCSKIYIQIESIKKTFKCEDFKTIDGILVSKTNIDFKE